jgi:hypothetical protein
MSGSSCRWQHSTRTGRCPTKMRAVKDDDVYEHSGVDADSPQPAAPIQAEEDPKVQQTISGHQLHSEELRLHPVIQSCRTCHERCQHRTRRWKSKRRTPRHHSRPTQVCSSLTIGREIFPRWSAAASAWPARPPQRCCCRASGTAPPTPC